MSRASQILFSTPSRIAFCALALLTTACGQKGPLFLPTGDAAAGRATLPQTLDRTSQPAAVVPAGTASAPPATGTAAPVRTP